MSEPEKPGENFLRRWSRLKQTTGAGTTASPEPEQSEHAERDELPEVKAQSGIATPGQPLIWPETVAPVPRSGRAECL